MEPYLLDTRARRWLSQYSNTSIVRFLSWVPMIFGPPIVALFLIYYVGKSGPISEHARRHLSISSWIAGLNIAISLLIWFVLARYTFEVIGNIGDFLIDRIRPEAGPASNGFQRI